MGVVVFGLVVPIAEIFAPSPMTFLFEVSHFNIAQSNIFFNVSLHFDCEKISVSVKCIRHITCIYMIYSI